MPAAEPNADVSYEDLIRIYRENCALSTAAECRRALSALRQLRLIEPSEIEQGGDRITKRDIEKAIDEATESLAILQYTSSDTPTPVITPADCLR
jgi:hypothetical protein